MKIYLEPNHQKRDGSLFWAFCVWKISYLSINALFLLHLTFLLFPIYLVSCPISWVLGELKFAWGGGSHLGGGRSLICQLLAGGFPTLKPRSPPWSIAVLWYLVCFSTHKSATEDLEKNANGVSGVVDLYRFINILVQSVRIYTRHPQAFQTPLGRKFAFRVSLELGVRSNLW